MCFGAKLERERERRSLLTLRSILIKTQKLNKKNIIKNLTYDTISFGYINNSEKKERKQLPILIHKYKINALKRDSVSFYFVNSTLKYTFLIIYYIKKNVFRERK
jgi:hypothetical protein